MSSYTDKAEQLKGRPSLGEVLKPTKVERYVAMVRRMNTGHISHDPRAVQRFEARMRQLEDTLTPEERREVGRLINFQRA